MFHASELAADISAGSDPQLRYPRWSSALSFTRMLPSIPIAACLLIPGIHSFPLNAPSDSNSQADAPSRRDTTTLIEAIVVTTTITRGGTATSTSSVADRTSAASGEAQIYFLPPNAAFAPTPGNNCSVPLAAIQKSDSGDGGGDPYPNSDGDPDRNTKDGDGDPTAPDPDPSVAPTPNTGGGDSPAPDPGVAPDPNGLPMQATKPLQGPLVMGYYPDWVADAFPPEKVDFSRFDWIDFAFAVPTEKFGLTFDGSADGGGLLRRLVAAAHKKGKKVKLSIGGWTGSKCASSHPLRDPY
ncbi:hypothetical protein EWM64_g5585 [Hericium alpestre]|uniref:GH18 domain-containing protein n=1 Tax=Hericium alpestre TaxID=135208 RepID=A0A4Y9ZWY4_9AGAM|nr:hypothetical protein EWM64_g5585 [Hericium alpestre]